MANPRLCSIPDCGKPHYGKGWCNKHYMRWRLNGDPNLILRGTENGTPLEWLRKHLSYDGDECLSWPFATSTHGYGGVCINGVDRRVNRVVCEEEHGPPPTPKHQAAHSCGNRLCVNRHHLRWATRSENEGDKIYHGTSNRGERNGSSKLSVEDVKEIRLLNGKIPRQEIAERFGIHPHTVNQIASGKTWAWL